jgi:predicted RNase H-like nuclease
LAHSAKAASSLHPRARHSARPRGWKRRNGTQERGDWVSVANLGILRKIEAVDAMMTSVVQGNVRELGPEVTFAWLKY